MVYSSVPAVPNFTVRSAAPAAPAGDVHVIEVVGAIEIFVHTVDPIYGRAPSPKSEPVTSKLVPPAAKPDEGKANVRVMDRSRIHQSKSTWPGAALACKPPRPLENTVAVATESCWTPST